MAVSRTRFTSDNYYKNALLLPHLYYVATTLILKLTPIHNCNRSSIGYRTP